jgi:hypothetical protein
VPSLILLVLVIFSAVNDITHWWAPTLQDLEFQIAAYVLFLSLQISARGANVDKLLKQTDLLTEVVKSFNRLAQEATRSRDYRA